jgi:hypothetical protein
MPEKKKTVNKTVKKTPGKKPPEKKNPEKKNPEKKTPDKKPPQKKVVQKKNEISITMASEEIPNEEKYNNKLKYLINSIKSRNVDIDNRIRFCWK